jgi:DNA-binding NtrC family response regulator
VLIEGETGTGEQLAEAQYERIRAAGLSSFSTARGGPELDRVRLFGQRGAYRLGGNPSRRAERAHGTRWSTTAIRHSRSSPLLRDRARRRHASAPKRRRVDVRLLFATRRDLDHEVTSGRFRDDLFHRVAVARLELPPLRSRHGDVEFLARLFCGELGSDPSVLADELLHRWHDYAWPGNVRELRNAVLRFIAVGDIDDSRARWMAPARRAACWRSPQWAIRRAHLALTCRSSTRELAYRNEQRYLDRVLAFTVAT